MHDHPRREKATVGSVVRHPRNRLRFSWNVVAINSCDFVVTFALVGFQVFLDLILKLEFSLQDLCARSWFLLKEFLN